MLLFLFFNWVIFFSKITEIASQTHRITKRKKNWVHKYLYFTVRISILFVFFFINCTFSAYLSICAKLVKKGKKKLKNDHFVVHFIALLFFFFQLSYFFKDQWDHCFIPTQTHRITKRRKKQTHEYLYFTVRISFLFIFLLMPLHLQKLQHLRLIGNTNAL